MPKPVWTGTITFGLVNIPVKLYNRVRKTVIRLHQLRKSDGCRIRYKKICASDGREVVPQEIRRGYQISPDRYVVVSDEELAALYPKATHTIEIEDFVKLEQIDPVYYQQSFYLVPDKGATKAYALLRQAMENTGRIGIARLVLRSKEFLAALQPVRHGLGLATMVFQEEMVDPISIDPLYVTEAAPDKKELHLARQLIESLAITYEPENYRNTFHQQLMTLIEDKAATEQLTVRPSAEKAQSKVIDLMAALEASLAAAGQNSPPRSTRRKEKVAAAGSRNTSAQSSRPPVHKKGKA
ncbi:MAG: Ku protein [Negativicutes bacterium]|nr:Ku protein [Negativicutes bacterium]